MKKGSHNNYTVAIVCIVAIVLLVTIAVSVTVNTEEAAGQAYLSNVHKTPGMTKIYTQTEPYAYAYLRDE